ncbi:MAG: hypothetical protein Kow001_18730 [Acidobacteriota bacterium]
MQVGGSLQEAYAELEPRPLEQALRYRVTVGGRIFEGTDYRRLLAEAVRVWRAHRTPGNAPAH